MSKPLINTMADLQKYLQNTVVKQAVNGLKDDVARNVYELLREYVIDTVYNQYSPRVYERSYELLNSITIGKVKQISNEKYEIEIYFDPEKMYHTSYYGSDTLGIAPGERVYIAEWVNDGKWSQHPIGRHDTPNFMQKTITQIKQDKIILKRMMGYLKSKGYDVK